MITHDLGVVAELSDDILVMYAGRCVEYASVEDAFHKPLHPYTWGLLESIPHVESKGTRLVPIEGLPPSLIFRPSGCPFHPRCPAFMPGTCDRSEPALARIGERQSVSCFLYEPTAVSDQPSARGALADS
jgi:peptide/nickel transport system ATP-binding protein